MNNKIECKRVQEEFNNLNNIKNIIEEITGEKIKNKSLCCPIHGGDNKNGASIHLGKNVFSCWTGECGKAIDPWNFVKKYYGLTNFKEVAEKVNYLFNANIPIFEKKEKEYKQVDEYEAVYKVSKYLSEAKSLLKDELSANKHILLNANTGLGKTFGVVDLMKDNSFGDDYIFFLVPTRSIAEQVAEEYPVFKLFYGNDTVLPTSKFIVSTYHKIHMLELAIEREIESRALMGEFPPTYSVVLDECHELMSKRKLLSGKARTIETFIKNADSSITMSANTNYFYKTYKDNGLFNKYISVEAEQVRYNANTLNIYRLPSKEEQKTQIVINTIKEKLNNYDKVLFYEDSIEKLNEYSRKLNKIGIENVVINAKNKEDDGTKEDYKGIIKDSKLVKKVTLTTSLINAGVNIKDNNISLIVKQDKNKFDILKTEQFLARVRTEGNDLSILLSSSEKEAKNIVKYDNFLYRALKEAENINLGFNIDVLEAYGIEINNEEFKNLWDGYKNNEAYSNAKELMYVDGTVLKTDIVAVYEKARLDFERANYYNDDFILDQLERVKARDKKISYLAPVTIVKEDKKGTSKESNLGQALNEILQESEQVTELYKLAIKEVKGSNLENEELKAFYDEYSQNKIFKEMLKNMRECLLPYLDNEQVSKITLFTQLLLIYTEEKKKKERDLKVANIRRVETLNKTLPVGVDKAKIKATGDYVYIAVRKNFDCYTDGHHPVSKRTYDWALSDLLDLRQLKVLDNKYYIDNKGKKVKIKDTVEEIKICVESIYNLSESNYIYGLK